MGADLRTDDRPAVSSESDTASAATPRWQVLKRGPTALMAGTLVASAALPTARGSAQASPTFVSSSVMAIRQDGDRATPTDDQLVLEITHGIKKLSRNETTQWMEGHKAAAEKYNLKVGDKDGELYVGSSLWSNVLRLAEQEGNLYVKSTNRIVSLPEVEAAGFDWAEFSNTAIHDNLARRPTVSKANLGPRAILWLGRMGYLEGVDGSDGRHPPTTTANTPVRRKRGGARPRTGPATQAAPPALAPPMKATPELKFDGAFNGQGVYPVRTLSTKEIAKLKGEFIRDRTRLGIGATLDHLMAVTELEHLNVDGDWSRADNLRKLKDEYGDDFSTVINLFIGEAGPLVRVFTLVNDQVASTPLTPTDVSIGAQDSLVTSLRLFDEETIVRSLMTPAQWASRQNTRMQRWGFVGEVKKIDAGLVVDGIFRFDAVYRTFEADGAEYVLYRKDDDIGAGLRLAVVSPKGIDGNQGSDDLEGMGPQAVEILRHLQGVAIGGVGRTLLNKDSLGIFHFDPMVAVANLDSGKPVFELVRKTAAALNNDNEERVPAVMQVLKGSFQRAAIEISLSDAPENVLRDGLQLKSVSRGPDVGAYVDGLGTRPPAPRSGTSTLGPSITTAVDNAGRCAWQVRYRWRECLARP